MMIYDPREIARVRDPMLLMTAAAWGMLLGDPDGKLMFAHSLSTHGMHALHVNPPTSLAAGWLLMLLAMMAPTLVPPIHHLRLQSFTHRRARAIALFIAAYVTVWIAAGVVLLATALAVNAAIALVIALVWQCSPTKQRCLNRCHAHTPIAAFGTAADLDALRFGAAHGVWCAGTCWALMLVTMLLPAGHIIAMLVVTTVIVSERLEAPVPPRWRLRVPDTAIRILVAQLRIRRLQIFTSPHQS